MHRVAVAVTDGRVYLVPSAAVAEVADRLNSAWDSIRTRTLGFAEGAPVIAAPGAPCPASGFPASPRAR